MLEPMEILINQILEKHDVENENLAKALIEIFDAYHKLAQQKSVIDFVLKDGLH